MNDTGEVLRPQRKSAVRVTIVTINGGTDPIEKYYKYGGTETVEKYKQDGTEPPEN